MDKVYLVGAGYWGSKVLEELKGLGKEVSVIDARQGTTIEQATQPWPVILATPADQHFEQARYFLSRNRDVYVEKPMAQTQDECEELKKLEGDNILMVGHIFIHHMHGQLIKKIITNGDIGKIISIKSERTNWGIYQTKITPVSSLAVHDISFFNYLGDGVVNVNHVESNNYTHNGVPDRVRFKGEINGIHVECDASWYSPIRRRLVTVIGTEGTLVWDTDKETLVKTNHMLVDGKLNKEVVSKTFEFEGPSPLSCELKHFFDCIAYREQGYPALQRPKTNVDSAIDVAKVVDLIESKLVY
tara:strand:+ start:3971 stop:4873 length:903 start_codon:yes stop_codon:yes gene_type:complete